MGPHRHQAMALAVWALGGACGGCASGGAATGGAGAGGQSPSGAGGAGGPATLGGCLMFPADDAWNTDVSGQAVDTTWTARLRARAGAMKLHPDFGADYGIPINVVPATQPLLPITFDAYPSESDPGPYPFPSAATIKIEGGTPATCAGDCHVLVLQQGACLLYEGYACRYAGGWHCDNGAKWNLKKTSYGQRPTGWTSADAAGLAILPGLLRHAEAAAGAVNHAVRFTLRCTTNKYVRPATHQAVPTVAGLCDPHNPDPTMPPMGMRVRLEASYDISTNTPLVQTILRAMQRYGLILADNGSDFFFQGDPDPGWNNTELDQLKAVPASAFEVVTMPPLQP